MVSVATKVHGGHAQVQRATTEARSPLATIASRLHFDSAAHVAFGEAPCQSRLTLATPRGSSVACNQVLYNLTRRGIELDLVPWCRDQRIPIMAYSPIEQARLLSKKIVKRVAGRHGATPAQVCLAWVLRQKGVIAIPKAGTPEHVREDYDALELELTKADLRELDEAFPAPPEPQPLEII